MTTLREAAQQALEALEALDAPPSGVVDHYELDRRKQALRAALAQQEQEQEPVAWRYKGMMGMPWSLSDDGYYVSCKRDKGYTVEPLYTHPPRREWQSLTEEEIAKCWHDTPWNADLKTRVFAFFHTVEAALKERNT
jgi:hypothetical protein